MLVSINTTTQQLLQWSGNTVLFLMICSVVLIAAGLYYIKSHGSDSDNAVSIKIDRQGKYHYDMVPDSGNSNLIFWIKILIALLVVFLFLLPFNQILYRQ